MCKKVAILQSNYIPWKGYFDLIASVDEFILYDDMQYTRRDWRNRNKIKTPNGLQWLTIPVKVKGRYYQRIRDTEIDGVDWIESHWMSLCQNYRRAPYFSEVAHHLESLLLGAEYTHLHVINKRMIEWICHFLGIEVKISCSWDYKLIGDKTERIGCNTMGKKFKLGFIGGGLNSAVGATHFIASQMDGRFQVSAGCFSRHNDVNTQTSERWHIPQERRYSQFQDLLEHEVDYLDAIVVLTPTPDHVEPVIQALKLGYPVICEKALAASSGEAQLIKKVQAEHNGFLAVTYNYTGYPMLRELKYLIQQGKLGLIEQIHIEMPQEGFARLNRDGKPVIPQQWRLHDAELPTLSLDLGVHIHNIVDFLTGEKPLELVAMQSSQGRFRQVVDNTMCIARYTNNLECNIWFSKSALGYRNGLRVRVFGEEGSVEWYQMEPEFLIYHDNQGHQMIIDRASVDVGLAHLPCYNRFKSGHPAGFLEAFANLYSDIANELEAFCNQNHQPESDYIFTVQHALEGLVMLEAIAHSSKTKRWQTIGFQV